MFEIIFALTILCVVVLFVFARWVFTGRHVRDLWLLFFVMGISFAWLLYVDSMAWLGDDSIRTGQWRAFVHRGSIGLTGCWVLWRNRHWR